MLMFREFARDESGASVAQYGLVAALLSLLVLASMSHMGAETVDLWTLVEGEIDEMVHVFAMGKN